MKVWAAIHQGPSASGRERHFAPLSWRQMIALIVRRRCRGGTLAAGRQASISGASTSHCSSVRPIAPSSKPKERPPRPRVQALTGPSKVNTSASLLGELLRKAAYGLIAVGFMGLSLLGLF